MKKLRLIVKPLIIILAFTLILLTFSACSWFDSGGNLDENSDDTTKPSYSPLKTPSKIEGLYVGTCEELFADMRSNDKETDDNELYRAAAVILANDNRIDESNACCDNIQNENLKISCKIRS